MRLLFDNNISRKLIGRLADLFTDSSHVALVCLERADDDVVWGYAIEHGFVSSPRMRISTSERCCRTAAEAHLGPSQQLLD